MGRIGTAGWTIPRTSAEHFPTEGAGLERYATVLPAAEINTMLGAAAANALELMGV